MKQTSKRRLLVAKLGGSLADSARRDLWLAAFGAARDPLILVPGGGPFAREVRAEQIRTKFDDVEAHRRALFAMERFGALLAGSFGSLRPRRLAR